MARAEVAYFDHEGSDCKDRYHRRCTGRWRGELNLGKDARAGAGRFRPRTKAELQIKLDQLREEINQGVRSSPHYTVAEAVAAWLAGPMADGAAKTIKTQGEILTPLLAILGETPLRDLTADDVSKALLKLAKPGRRGRSATPAHRSNG